MVVLVTDLSDQWCKKPKCISRSCKDCCTSAGFFRISVFHAGTQGSKLPSSSTSTVRGTESLGHCRWPLPRFSPAVALSTDAHTPFTGKIQSPEPNLEGALENVGSK